jgi:hypothetical protein
MGYFDKLAQLGFMVVCRRNPLGTTTMTAVRESDYEIEEDSLYNEPSNCWCYDLESLLEILPEWRVVDFVGDDAAKGAQMLYEKLTCTGAYFTWDERMASMPDKLIGFEHRPESERFRPVPDAPSAPPELVENLNLQDP